jgi:hypothetical protein
MTRRIVSFFLLCLEYYYSNSQELEPRAYAAVPKDLNTIAIGYSLSRGNILNEPSLPISDFTITAHGLGMVYQRTFGFCKKLARVQISTPLVHMSGQLKINGRDTSGTRTGFGDTRIRFGINLIGTPVLSRKEFTTYTQKTIIGVSLVTSVPTGKYYDEKRINIGSNRWGFKPEVGISKRINRIYAEAYAGIWFYTGNKHFLTNKTLEQEPVLNVQAHASYYFKNRMWVSVNTNWFNGGRTNIDDVPQGDLLDNWRVGGTWSFPIAKKAQFLKLQFHVGAFTSSNYHYDVVSLVYQYIF